MPAVPAVAIIEVSPLKLAEWFADMGDEDQAQFFIEVAHIAETWEGTNMDQWYAVGRHLTTCVCSSPEARDLIRRLAAGVGEERG